MCDQHTKLIHNFEQIYTHLGEICNKEVGAPKTSKESAMKIKQHMNEIISMCPKYDQCASSPLQKLETIFEEGKNKTMLPRTF